MVTKNPSVYFKNIVPNFRFGRFLPGFPDRFDHRTRKMFATYVKFAQYIVFVVFH